MDAGHEILRLWDFSELKEWHSRTHSFFSVNAKRIGRESLDIAPEFLGVRKDTRLPSALANPEHRLVIGRTGPVRAVVYAAPTLVARHLRELPERPVAPFSASIRSTSTRMKGCDMRRFRSGMRACPPGLVGWRSREDRENGCGEPLPLHGAAALSAS